MKDLQEPQISVIIPCYNSEKYIGETLDSILSQTYQDFEILCMDDGSTDRTGEVLDEYAAAHECIRVYHDENRGQACQRNAGMDQARGKYIYFIDSDDKIAGNCLERLYTFAEENHLDVVYFEAESFYETEDLERSHPQYKTLYHRKKEVPGILTGEELYLRLRQEGGLIISPCLQFSRKGHLKEGNIRFPDMRSLEDNIFTVSSMLKAERTACLSESLYLRRIRNDSVMTREVGKERFEAYFHTMTLFLEILQEYEEKEELRRALCNQISVFYRNFRRDYEKLSEEQRKGIFAPPENEELYYMMLMQIFVNIRDTDMNEERKRWREKKQNLEEKAEKKRADLDQVKETLRQVRKEKTELREEMKQIQKEKTELRGELKQVQKEKAEVKEELKQTQKERDAGRKELSRTQEEKEKLNEKLQKTYREKSEINAKLQQTYREKSERGEEIKRLRNSLDYRIGHKILWLPRKVKSLFAGKKQENT